MDERAVSKPLSWSELWASLEPRAVTAALKRVLGALSREAAFERAVRQAFGVQPEQRADELSQLVARACAGDVGPSVALLRNLGAALARSGVEYGELRRIGELARVEVSALARALASADQARASALFEALHEAIAHSSSVVGEAYVAAREERVGAERHSIEVALRSSQTRFTRLFDAGILGILICDVAGNIKEANDCFLDMVGYSRDDLLSGRVRWAEMTPPEWQTLDEVAIEQLKERGVTNTWEKEYIRKDGSRVPILVGVAMLDELDCIAFVLDITERRRLEQLRARSAELEAQNARVQESSRLKNEFLANMSHELRTPLNSIIGFADILHDGEVPTESPKHRELLGDILRSGKHLLQLINDVLDLAKVEAGKLDFRPEPVDLTQLVSEVASILRSTAASKQIRIETEIDPSLSELLLDSARLKQVLYNYASNALKFTETGGRVTIRGVPEGDALFRLSVTDTGIGIAEQDLSRLFIEFQQLDAGTAKRHAGTGLGLALTKRIVEAQAGSVGVTSKLGAGSTFFAILPREATLIEDLEQAEPEPEPRVREGSDMVLVVEDDARDRRLLMRILSDAGYGVEQASTGAQAIAACAKRAYDAITLDLLLPDMTGLDVLHRIRLDGVNQVTLVVIVSVVAEKGVIGGYPVHDYLSKPVNSHDLVTCLRRAQIATKADSKIWVIDDDPSALKLMETVLTQLGYLVECHDKPALALERLELDQPAAIVLDLMMPDIDGFEFLARIRKRPEHDRVPVVVWTMKDLTSDDHKRLHRGAQAVLLKGYDRNQSLTEHMRVLLQRAIAAAAKGGVGTVS